MEKSPDPEDVIVFFVSRWRYFRSFTGLTFTITYYVCPHLPVPYVFGSKLPVAEKSQVPIDPWFQKYRELEDEGIHTYSLLVGSFNPFETYQSTCIISGGRDENNKCFKPPPRLYKYIHTKASFVKGPTPVPPPKVKWSSSPATTTKTMHCFRNSGEAPVWYVQIANWKIGASLHIHRFNLIFCVFF